MSQEHRRELRKCRLCLCDDKLLIYLFEASGIFTDVAKAIMEVLHYEIFKDDRFPPYICSSCSDKLWEFRAFKVKCDNAKESFEFFLSKTEEPLLNHEDPLLLDSVIMKEELFPDDISPSINNGVSVNATFQAEKARIGPIRLKEEFGIFEREEPETGDSSIPKDDLPTEKLSRKDDQDNMENSNFEVFTESIVAEELKAEEMDFEEWNTDCYNEQNEARVSVPEMGSETTLMLRSEWLSLAGDSETHQNFRREEGITEFSKNRRRKRKLKVFDKVFGLQDSETSHIPTKHVGKETEKVETTDAVTSRENVDNKGYRCNTLLKDHEAVKKKKLYYTCDLCKKGFNKRGNLMRHLQIHTGGIVQECEVCKKHFCHHYTLNQQQVIHDINKPYVCRYCERSFSFKNSLDRHLRIHTGIKTHECQLCSIKFHTRFELIQHCQKHDSGDLQWKLSEARKLTEEENSKEEKGRYGCKTCQKVFLYKSILSCHEMTHSTEGHFVCNMCLKVYTRKINFEKHIHGHIEKRFEQNCKYCGKQFKCKSLLENHESVHENKRSHMCEFCKKGFYTQSDLNTHLLIHTGRKAHYCKICNKRFRHEFTLLKHLRTHETYTCDFCKKEFRLKSRLKKHMQTHIGNKTYKCQLCKKKFLTISHLSQHLHTHDMEGQFQCQFCDKKYKHKYLLRDHEKTHINPRPFKCPFCTRCFSSASSFYRHKNIHGKGK